MNATENAVLKLTIKLAQDTEANRFVQFNGATAAAAGVAAGPTYMKGKLNERVAVTVLGAAPAVAGGAIAEGAELQVGNDGKVITRAAGKTVGWALEAAAADGDALSIFIVPNHT